MLKKLLKILFGLFVVLGLGIVAIITFVDLNHFKNTLSQQVNQHTGRKLQIAGDIKWTFRPWLSLEIQRVSLSNPAGFEGDFLSFKKLWIEPHLSTLVTGKLFVSLDCEEVHLALEKENASLNNWDDIFRHFNQKKNPTPQKSRLSVLVGGLKLSNVSIDWHDKLDSQHLQFTHLNLSAEKLYKALLGNAIPITLSTHLNNLQNQKSANIALNTEVRLHPIQKNVAFSDIILKLQLQEGVPATIEGNLNIEHFDTQPSISGTLKLPNVNTAQWLKGWLENLPPSLPKTLSAKLAFHYQAPVLDISYLTLHFDKGQIASKFKIQHDLEQPFLLKKLTGTGEIQAEHIMFGNLLVPHFDSEFQLNDGIALWGPYHLMLFEAAHSGTITLDFNKEKPQLLVEQMAPSLEINNVLKAFGQPDKLMGKGSLKTQLMTSGHTTEELLNNLSGRSEIALHDGELRGINLEYLLKHLQTTIKSMLSSIKAKSFSDFGNHVQEELAQWKEQSTNNTGFITPFETLKANVTIQDQLLNNPDFLVLGPQYQLQGHGSVNLRTDTLRYQLHANLISDDADKNDLTKFFKNTPLHINILGPLNNPVVKPDLEMYIQSALKYQQRTYEEMAGKALKKLFH
jgi:AsmA protein